METKFSNEFFFAINNLPENEKVLKSEFFFPANLNVLNPNWRTGYSEIKSDLKTGDIFLVHGKYQYSWIAELLQWSKWTHTAIVIRASDIDPGGEKNFPELMLWESNVGDQKVKNLWGKDNSIKEGPMLISLEDRLNNTITYPDVQIVVRPLGYFGPKLNFQNLTAYFDSVIALKFPSDIEVIHSIYLGRKYNRSSDNPQNDITLFIDPSEATINVIKADVSFILDSLSDQDIHDKDAGKMYCSQLVAETYKTLGLLTNNFVSNAYSPKDFSAEGGIRLLKRSLLGEEMYIDMKK